MIDDILPLLPGYLGRQRWFAGAEPETVEIIDLDQVAERLHWLLVEADGARYQLLVGVTAGAPLDFLHGHEGAVLGEVASGTVYDGLFDPELATAFLARVAPDEVVARVRPMGAEQSNTSLIFDDRLVLKVFRRIHAGANPDVEVTAALADVGFGHVAPPVANWERDGTSMAVVQPLLSGGIDGWALALTSLRDLYASEVDDPADCGGDFAGESERLGHMTGSMHVALSQAFPTGTGDVHAWLDVMHRQLARVGAGRPWRPGAGAVLDRLRSIEAPGAAIRVHGDYHLGQVLRTDAGWFVLDFEGEPARPLDERRLPSSPLKDVAGMLRSFQYATAVALRERPEAERESHRAPADAWEQRNRNALLEGYLAAPGVSDLLPPNLHDTLASLAAWELDKAIYELAYELDHRPDWAAIPEAAIAKLTAGVDEA